MTVDTDIKIGVLALQGSFREHIACFRRIPGVLAVEIRTKQQLESVDGLVIPGGVYGSVCKLSLCMLRRRQGSEKAVVG